MIYYHRSIQSEALVCSHNFLSTEERNHGGVRRKLIKPANELLISRGARQSKILRTFISNHAYAATYVVILPGLGLGYHSKVGYP